MRNTQFVLPLLDNLFYFHYHSIFLYNAFIGSLHSVIINLNDALAQDLIIILVITWTNDQKYLAVINAISCFVDKILSHTIYAK